MTNEPIPDLDRADCNRRNEGDDNRNLALRQLKSVAKKRTNRSFL
jgi:hypothetical protein